MSDTKRKSISKKLRFEVFKRDSFTCQYCGRMAPDIILQVDHINPVKNGGDNDILNLITSCFDCNSGKGARKLTDRQELQKQQEQLKLLSERKEQLEFMVQWRQELLSISDTEADIAEAEIFKYNNKFKPSEHGRRELKILIEKYSLSNVLEAIAISYPRYNTEQTAESWRLAFEKVGGICRNKQYEREDPTFPLRRRAYYVFRNNFRICDEQRIKNVIKKFVRDEDSLYQFFNIIDESHNWTEFFKIIEGYGVE